MKCWKQKRSSRNYKRQKRTAKDTTRDTATCKGDEKPVAKKRRIDFILKNEIHIRTYSLIDIKNRDSVRW